MIGTTVQDIMNGSPADSAVNLSSATQSVSLSTANQRILDRSERARIIWVGVYSLLLMMLFIFVNILVATLLLGSARGWLTIDSTLMATLVGATIVEIIGILYIAVKYVFKNFFTNQPVEGR